MFEDENWTVYRSTLTGAVYVRLTEEFRDGRFEQLPDTTDSTDLPPLDDSRLSSKSEIADAANEMYATLLLLSGPRDAAKAIALTHLLVIEADDTKSEETVRAKMKEVTDFVIENWHGAARGHG
jgi:hypothetical protein